MNDVIYAFYMTMELWIFLGILLTALVIESIINTSTANKERNL
jgi:hypothetical protein